MKRYVNPRKEATTVVLKSKQQFLVVVKVPESILKTNLELQRFTEAPQVMSLGEDNKGYHFIMIPPEGKVTKVPAQFVSNRP